jgi:dTDP-4-amino-4,6-dideoxygalactose transaminase
MEEITAEKLAIDGGTPVRTEDPIVETDIIEEEEIESLLRVVRQKKLRRAEAAREYEAALADWFGVKHAIAVANGTVSLHVALAAMGIGPGDEVIVTPYTFVASNSCVLEQNAIPVFADIDPEYLTIDPEDVERKITPRTKAIIPVSISGIPMDMDPLMELAEKHGLWVLEDNAQAPGATYKGRKLGTIGHVASYSTIAGKIMTTGEGGFLITDDDELYERMWAYQDFARRKALGKASKFHFGIPCTNYRITNMQAAIGLEQIKKLDEFNARRKEHAHYLEERLRGIPGIRLIKDPPWGERVYFYYVIRIEPDVLGATLLDFAKALSAEGVYDYDYITTTRMMDAQHLEPLFVDKIGYGGTKCPFECPLYEGHVEYGEGQLPVVEKLAREIFWLSSVHPRLKKKDLDDTIAAVRKVATVFAARHEVGMSNTYASSEEQSLAWDPYYTPK